jgi:predicted nucleotidyltransferase
MIIYEMYSIRYFRCGKTVKDNGINCARMGVSGSRFLLLGVYEKVIWPIISYIILGICHVGIHIRYLK